MISLDRNTGKPLWQRTIIKTPLETIHRLNSRASCTPVTDGKLIYVAVMKVDDKTIPAPNVGTARLITPGSIEVVAFDLKGNRKWSGDTKSGDCEWRTAIHWQVGIRRADV